jgi:hypothetical protein
MPSPPRETLRPTAPGITALGTIKALAELLGSDPDLVVNLSYVPAQGFQARLRSSAGLRGSAAHPNLHTALHRLVDLAADSAR